MRQTIVICAVVLCARSWLGAEEFQVNGRTSGAQANAAVTADADGRIAVVWSSYFSSSGRSNDILVRRLDTTGRSLDADEVQVNTVWKGNQTEPAAATNGAGMLLVAWHGPGLDAEGIFARLFHQLGAAMTDEFPVNATVEGQQLYPSVAGSEAGTFVVVWESRQADAAGKVGTIRGQLFDGHATPLGSEISIDAQTRDARYPNVAMDAAGGFVVTWLQAQTMNAVMARRFDANGVPLGEPFQVNEVTFASITQPAVAMSPSGDFVIVWDGDPNRAGDDDVHGRCFDPNGMPQTGQFTVTSLCEGAQQYPRVAIDDANAFVVVWQHDHGDPNLATDVWARRFDAAGSPQGEQFQLNGYVAGKQQSPDVAIAAGEFLVTIWQSDGQDGSGYGVFARIEPWTTAEPDAVETPHVE